MYDSVTSEDSFMLVYCPDRYKTQKMRDEAADDYLAALKFIPDCFVRTKMIKKLLTTLYADDNILYFKEILVMSCFLVMKLVFLGQILIILALTILIMLKMTLKLLFMSEFWFGIVNLTALKKEFNEELMLGT